MQPLEKSQRTLGNNGLQLKEALVIGSYAGQVYTLACAPVLHACRTGHLLGTSLKYDQLTLWAHKPSA